MLLKSNSLIGFQNNARRFNNFRKFGKTPSDTQHRTYVEEISQEGRN